MRQDIRWVTKEEAARLLGVSTDTIERRLRRGELQGQREERVRGWRWLIAVPDDAPADAAAEGAAAPADAAAPPSDTSANGEAHAAAEETLSWKDMVDTLRDEVGALRGQLEVKDRQIGELHVLLQQAQASLPAPKERWWRRLWRR